MVLGARLPRMIYAYLACLLGLIFVSATKGSEVDLRRSWRISCWLPVLMIGHHLLAGSGGQSARDLMQLESMKEMVGWGMVMVILFGMRAALAPRPE